MHRVIILLFVGAGLVCGALLYSGADLAPPAYKVSSLPTEVLDDIKYVKAQKKERVLHVFFSSPGGFYAEPVLLSLSSNYQDASIHYTLDGSTPTRQSPHYTEPLRLLPSGDAACVVVKAVAYHQVEASSVQTASFFIGAQSRAVSPSYVFSLSTDPDNLFGYEKGILVPGKKYDDYMRKNDSPSTSLWRRDANYNEHGADWERPVYVEAFAPNGQRVISQLAGARVHGESSRGLEQKSIRLIARKRYEAKAGKFKYGFFPQLAKADAYKAPIRTADSLVLSNGGSLYSDAQIVDPTIIRIARESGYAFSSPVESAAVYINGAYYGHAWLTIRPNEQHYKKLFDAPDDSFEFLEGGEHKVYTINPAVRYEFWQLHQAAAKGFADENAYNVFKQKMDVSNLLTYMALEIYVGNSDWPRSNVRIWRYQGPHDYANQDPALDGRWRYILFDAQIAMDAGTDSGNKANYAFPYIRYSREHIPFLNALLVRPELAEEFANNLCDMAFVHYTPENVRRISSMLIAQAGPQLQFSADHPSSSQKKVRDISASLQAQQNQMLSFVEKRPDYILSELRDMFGYTELFHVTLEGPGRINTSKTGEGWYFIENTVPVFADLPRWRIFDYWLVNGKKRTERKLTVSGMDAVNGEVSIRLVSHEEKPRLYLGNAYDNGDICGFSLLNSTGQSQNGNGLYLSDKIYEPNKFAVPEITTSPGGSIDFVGQSYRSTGAMLKVKLSFNPRQNEVIYLFDGSGKILDTLVMPARSVAP